MDTFMNADNANQSTSYGEYPVSSSSHAASSSVEALPTSTEGLAQYDTTTNEIGLDTQINTAADFQSLTNLTADESDFAKVNVLSSGESSGAQISDFAATTSTENVDFTAPAQVETNMNFDTILKLNTVNIKLLHPLLILRKALKLSKILQLK